MWHETTLLQLEAYSQVLAESSLALKQKDLQQSGSLNVTHTHEQSSKNTGLQPLFMKTLQQLILKQYRKLTSLQDHFHVRTLASLEKELALKGVKVHSGNINLKQLASYDQSTHLLRTLQHSLQEGLTSSLQTLPKSGMMRNGIIYQLPQLVRITGAKESLFLPTPTCSDAWTSGLKSTQIKPYNRHSETIAHLAGGLPEPTFVERVMGFPVGHTELLDSETQSFRKSPRSSRKQSKKLKVEVRNE